MFIQLPWGGERKRKIHLGMASIAIVSGLSQSLFANGTSGGQILNMGVGARAIAMGEAYTAQADDVSSLYWNPAGIGLLNQSQASFMYNQSD